MNQRFSEGSNREFRFRDMHYIKGSLYLKSCHFSYHRHGILVVGTKPYQRGASLGQLLAFLVASPWNSLSLTIILVSLIGLGWTLLYILLSMLVGIISDLLFDRLVANGVLPASTLAEG